MISAPPSTSCSRSSSSTGRWTGWCAATSVLARPRSPWAAFKGCRCAWRPQQHAATFRDRFRDFPCESRWCWAGLAWRARSEGAGRCVGKVDEPGRHYGAAVRRDVVPQDLGLVIVDEEQRFGVAQKELLRQLRLEVDVLAMSATPIPRTLHDLSGLRDITVPRRGRHPIIEFPRGTRPRADLHRAAPRGRPGGHRPATASKRLTRRPSGCAARVPSSALAVNGQMTERSLESVMMKFCAGTSTCWCRPRSSSWGLDIPQANTLVVERADLA